SRYWAKIGIPILWRNPFKFCTKSGIKSLKEFIYTSFYLQNNSEMQNLFLFPYLSYIKEVNIFQIKNIFKDNHTQSYIFKLLFISSNIINHVIIDKEFKNFKVLNEYMKDHKIHLEVRFDSEEKIDDLKILEISDDKYKLDILFFDRLLITDTTKVTMRIL
ncbi:9116_t:CDS:1, partial [Scutellospora calospora]